MLLGNVPQERSQRKACSFAFCDSPKTLECVNLTDSTLYLQHSEINREGLCSLSSVLEFKREKAQ